MMRIETTLDAMRKVKDFLEYHASVLDDIERAPVTSIDIGTFTGKKDATIFLNEEAFDRVIKNPKIIMDYGCDPLGVEVTLHSNKTMKYSFIWDGLEIMCLKDLDLSKLTSQQSEASP